MVTVSDEILEKLRKFLRMVSDSGLHIDRAILFGSYAKGTGGIWSDITETGHRSIRNSLVF